MPSVAAWHASVKREEGEEGICIAGEGGVQESEREQEKGNSREIMKRRDQRERRGKCAKREREYREPREREQ